MPKYLLSVDNGGTYIKAALFDLKGKQIGISKQYNEVLTPGIGLTEYNQDTLWEINCSCIRNLLAKTRIQSSDIICIGISAQGCGFYAIDQDGNSIRNAITSADLRAQPQVDRWEREGTNKRIYDRMYRLVTSGQPNAIMAWLKEHEPENYKRIHRVFSMKDLLIYRLTGKAVSGYGCTSATGLMNMHTREIDPVLTEAFGIQEMKDKFGPLYWDTQQCGVVSEKAAGECGLAAGTPVAAGSHDVVATAIAMGITDSEYCFMIAGTHGINGYISPEPITDGTIKYNEMFAFPGKYLVEEAYPCSTGTLEWVIDVLFDRSSRETSDIYAEINRLVGQVSPEEDIPVFLPYLRGSRDNPYACGTWDGLHHTHTRAHMLRAVYEGVAFAHKLQMECLLCNRAVPSRIRFAGGATKSPVWIQMFADVMGVPFEVVPEQEMGASGAAIVAAVAAGVYPDVASAVENMVQPGRIVYPRSEYTELYEKKYLRFKQVVDKDNKIWNRPAYW